MVLTKKWLKPGNQELNTQDRIHKIFNESINLKTRVEASCTDQIMRGFELIKETLTSGNKLLIFGNGGSAADAQHFACEIVGRCVSESPALPAIALTADSAILTAASNDYGFEAVFARQIEAHVKPGDLVIGISTSGNSPNICSAFEAASKKGVRSLGLLGNDGGKALEMVDQAVVVPSDITPRIQEMHITIIHIWCQLLEEQISSD